MEPSQTSVQLPLGGGVIEEEEPTTNVLETYTVYLNQRWSKSGKALTSTNGLLSIAIPVADLIGKAIRLNGFESNKLYVGGGRPQWYVVDTSNATKVTYGANGTYGFWDDTSDGLTITAQDDGSYLCEFDSTLATYSDCTLYILLVLYDDREVANYHLVDKTVELI